MSQTYTDVFGSDTVPPAEYGFRAVTMAADTEFFWPYNADGPATTTKLMEVTASVASLSMTLPDAREVSVGEDILIRNVGSNSLTVKSNDATVLATITAGEATYLYLTDNTTAGGAWGNVAFGVGTSSADAATLVGYGIMAVGSTLNQSHPVFDTASGILIDSTHRAQVVNFSGGADTLDLTSAVTLGNNFFTVIRNSGSGTLELVPNGVETIDGLASFTIQPSESLILCCSGTDWVTVGYGRSVNFNFTQLVKDVSAAGTFTLSTAEASNKLLTFIGTPASAVTVIVPNVVSVYYVLNSCSTVQNVTIKTAAGTGTVVPQTQRIITICDATNVYSAQSVQSNTSLSLTDGSVSLPSLNFASQTNTGVYKYGANGIAITVDGVLSLYADTNGVGTPVGFTLPQGTSAAPTAEGKVYWQSTTDTLSVGDGATAKEITSNTGTQTLTNKTLSTGTVVSAEVTNTATSAFQVPVGTTAQRPTGADGKVRYNSDLNRYEGYDETKVMWDKLGGGATGGGTDAVFYENDQTVTTSYSIQSGKNASTTGPLSIADGVTLTVPDSSRLVIL